MLCKCLSSPNILSAFSQSMIVLGNAFLGMIIAESNSPLLPFLQICSNFVLFSVVSLETVLPLVLVIRWQLTTLYFSFFLLFPCVRSVYSFSSRAKGNATINKSIVAPVWGSRSMRNAVFESCPTVQIKPKYWPWQACWREKHAQVGTFWFLSSAKFSKDLGFAEIEKAEHALCWFHVSRNNWLVSDSSSCLIDC